MTDKPTLSRDRRIAVGELKYMACVVLEIRDVKMRGQLLVDIMMRMQSLIEGESKPYRATDEDIKRAIATAQMIHVSLTRKNGEG